MGNCTTLVLLERRQPCNLGQIIWRSPTFGAARNAQREHCMCVVERCPQVEVPMLPGID